jgi:hypothetical protein
MKHLAFLFLSGAVLLLAFLVEALLRPEVHEEDSHDSYYP